MIAATRRKKPLPEPLCCAQQPLAASAGQRLVSGQSGPLGDRVNKGESDRHCV